MSEKCLCDKSGYCPRFKRQMHRRQYEICRGGTTDGLPVVLRNRWLALWAGRPLRGWVLYDRFSATRIRLYRLLRFAQAVLRHVAAGLPRASAAGVAARRAVCEPCFWRDKDKDQCNQCGCHLGGRKELVAKLAWAKERCPLYDPAKRPGEYWGPVPGEALWRRLLRRLGF